MLDRQRGGIDLLAVIGRDLRGQVTAQLLKRFPAASDPPVGFALVRQVREQVAPVAGDLGQERGLAAAAQQVADLRDGQQGFPSKRGHFLIADSCNFAASSDYRTPVHFVPWRPFVRRARGSPDAPRPGRGQAGACPYFLPEGPQWSPGSRPARRAVAAGDAQQA